MRKVNNDWVGFFSGIRTVAGGGIIMGDSEIRTGMGYVMTYREA